jgi:serine/threonine protein kinase
MALPARLTQPEIEAIIDIPQSQLRRVGAGGFGQTYKVNYRGKTYLRKDIEFHGDAFTKWSFGTEVKYLELVCSHPLYSLLPLTPYYFGSMIRGDIGYIIEELFSGANLDDVLRTRYLTAEEASYINVTLDFYVHQFFHKQLGILHLDLKPQNIFVRMHENKIVSIHLLDLGLTRAIGEEGHISGTRGFMHPTQISARSSGLRKIKHVEEFNTYALGLISDFLNGSIAPPDSIQQINTRSLIPRPWEADIPTSITNVLCSFGLIGFVLDQVIVDLLSIPGTNLNNFSSDGNTPLIVALANKNRILAVTYVRRGADVNLRNTRGSTPLHWAASQGLGGPLKLLLDKGADKDALTLQTDPWEPLATPLHWACKAGQLETATALLSAGANLSLRDGNGESTLDLAKKKKDTLSDLIKLLEAYKQRTGANMGGKRKSTRKVNRKRAGKTRKATGGFMENYLAKQVESELSTIRKTKAVEEQAPTYINRLINASAAPFHDCGAMMYKARKIIDILKGTFYDYVDSLGRNFLVMSNSSILNGAILYIRRIPRLRRYLSVIVVNNTDMGKSMRILIEHWISRIKKEVYFEVLKGNNENIHDKINMFIDTEISTICEYEEGPRMYLQKIILDKCNWGGEYYRDSYDKDPRCPKYSLFQ